MSRPGTRHRRARGVGAGLGLSVAVALLGTLVSTPAAAASDRVVFWPFRGDGAEQVQALVARQLGSFTIVPPQAVRKTAARIGARPGSARSLAALAQRLSARAIVQGVVVGREPWEVQVTVRDARDGSRIGTVVWAGEKRASLIEEIATDTSPRVRYLVDQTQPRGHRASSRGVHHARSSDQAPLRARKRLRRDDIRSGDDGQKRDGTGGDDVFPELEDAEGRADQPSAPLLSLAVGPRSISRNFTLTDNLSRMPGYRLPMAGAVGGEAMLFPGARAGGFFGHLGLSGRWESSVGATTQADNSARATKNEAYLLGGRGRIPLGAHTLLLGFDYGRHRFELDAPKDRLSPNVDYALLRPSLTGQMALGAGFSLTLGAAYLHVLEAKGLGDEERFPRLQARGVEADLRVGYAVHRDLELSVGMDVRHYGHVLNPRPGDRLVAGGASDQFLGGMALLTYVVR